MRITHKKISLGLFLFLVSFIFTSCLDTDYTGQTAYGDAFIKSVFLKDSVTVGYNVQLYTYSWSEMKSVSVNTGSDTENMINLDTIDYKYTFAYQPNEVSYSQDPPEQNDYSFNVTFDNDEQTVVKDYLSDQYILPPRIKWLEWDDVDKQIKLEWEGVNNAQIYSVALITPDGKVAFETNMLENTVTSIWINQYTYGWHNGLKPTETITYQIILRAFLFEPVASTFDIQCMALNDLYSIEWAL